MMPAQGESCLSPPKCGDDGGSEAPVDSAVKLQLEPAFQPFLNKFLFSMSEEFAACVEGWAGPEVFTRDALEVFIVRSRHLPGEACEACEALETCEHMPALGREALMQMQPDPADRNGVLTKCAGMPRAPRAPARQTLLCSACVARVPPPRLPP